MRSLSDSTPPLTCTQAAEKHAATAGSLRVVIAKPHSGLEQNHSNHEPQAESTLAKGTQPEHHGKLKVQLPDKCHLFRDYQIQHLKLMVSQYHICKETQKFHSSKNTGIIHAIKLIVTNPTPII